MNTIYGRLQALAARRGRVLGKLAFGPSKMSELALDAKAVCEGARAAKVAGNLDVALRLYRYAARAGSRDALGGWAIVLLLQGRSARDVRLARRLLSRVALAGPRGYRILLICLAAEANDAAQMRFWLQFDRDAQDLEWRALRLAHQLRDREITATEYALSLQRIGKGSATAMADLVLLCTLGCADFQANRRAARKLLPRLEAMSPELAGYARGLYELRWGGNLARAARWMMPAANAGHTDACMFCGWWLHRRGERSGESRRYLQHAASSGQAEAAKLLAVDARDPAWRPMPSSPSTALQVMRAVGWWTLRRRLVACALCYVVLALWFATWFLR